jgi:rhodanese-related sulfurtransferase
VNEISVTDLKSKHDAGEDFLLLDVREPDEIATASIAWAKTIPMREVPAHLDELPKDKPIAVMCHGGGRSGRITQFLNENGYPNAVNVAGGIDAWSTQIDPSVPTY